MELDEGCVQPDQLRRQCHASEHLSLHLQADFVLPPATPALPSLKVLKLVGLNLKDFPQNLASNLAAVTHLDLSENAFPR